jgi:hypothetical protein
MLYSIGAGAVVVLHASFVLFVLAGGLALRRWAWVAWLHVPALLYAIAIQSVGWSCPLTILEKELTLLAGRQPYAGEFLPHYVWSPLGLAGAQGPASLGLIAGIVLLNLAPYTLWIRHRRGSLARPAR